MFEKLAEIITNYVEVKQEDIKPESRFMSMLGEVEDELDVEIDPEKAANIRTVQEAADYLETLQ